MNDQLSNTMSATTSRGSGMSGEWPLVELERLTENYDGRRVPIKESERVQGPYPYYGASGIVDHVDGYLFDGEYLLIGEDGENYAVARLPLHLWQVASSGSTITFMLSGEINQLIHAFCVMR